MYSYFRFLALFIFVFTASTNAAVNNNVISIDNNHVRTWNAFADAVYQLHVQSIAKVDIKQEVTKGGYPGNPDYYFETKYIDKKTGLLVSRVLREASNHENVHVIEVYVRDAQGKVIRDYLAAYLPKHRHAPIQTLVNLHQYKDNLHAFRQFDASGARIYEQCQGILNGEAVFLSLEEHEFYPDESVLSTREYQHCFNNIPVDAGDLLSPLHDDRRQQFITSAQNKGMDHFQLIDLYSDILQNEPRNTNLLVKRGQLYFETRQFDLAVNDYTEVLNLDDSVDKAYFGRGMALARNGQIQKGIDDLSEYIKRHPDSSLAYTKRGVRYLWLHDEDSAASDLKKAIALNPLNAEANDDLGVIYARKGDYDSALMHFRRTITLDPTYAKGHHNFAMTLFITHRYDQALQSADDALKLRANVRGTLLLKVEILKALGLHKQAQKVEQDAEFLPEGNWSEQLSVQ